MPVDPRFYRVGGQLSASRMAERLGLDAGAAEKAVSGISELRSAGPDDLCFFDGRPADWPAEGTAAGICLVAGPATPLTGRLPLFIVCPGPREAFFRLTEGWIEPETHPGVPPRIHPAASVSARAEIANGVVVGERSVIGPFAYVGPGVQIGRDAQIGPHASITHALVGNSVSIQSGARIGEPGFGLLPSAGGHRMAPHFGRVIIQDGARIGANSCIDRGLLADTVIGEGAKIDNLCHVGHNTVVGRNVVMAAFAGLSGSVTIGDGAELGGRVGISDHARIGKGARLAAASGVFQEVPDGETWGGTPALPIREWHRQTLFLRKLARRKGNP